MSEPGGGQPPYDTGHLRELVTTAITLYEVHPMAGHPVTGRAHQTRYGHAFVAAMIFIESSRRARIDSASCVPSQAMFHVKDRSRAHDPPTKNRSERFARAISGGG